MYIEVQEGKRGVFHLGTSPDLPFIMSRLRRLEGRKTYINPSHDAGPTGIAFLATKHNLALICRAFPELTVYDSGPRRAAPEGRGLPPTPAPDGPSAPPTAPAWGGYRPRTEPYAFQERALGAAQGKNNFAFFCEQGTGKSKIAIDFAGIQADAGRINGAIILAPKGVHRQWAESQIPEHCGIRHTTLYWKSPRFVPIDLAPEDTGFTFLTINYDAMKTDRGFKALLKAIDDCSITSYLLIMDESHMVKNYRSKRWKATRLLALDKRCWGRIALTGTPIAKDLTDEWSQLRLVDEDILGIRYVTHFRNEYLIMGGFQGKVVLGPRNLDRFKKKTAPYVFRATKDELGIAPKQYSSWVFDMTPSQRESYNDMRLDLIAQIDSGEITKASNAVVKLLRLQQISNGFITNEGGGITSMFPDPLENPRINALRELLEADEEEDKIILWCRFRQDIQNLERSGLFRYVSYHGGIADKERQQVLQDWLSPGGARALLATPGSGGVGLNLQGSCHRAIYYSNSENAIQRWQSEDRIHRIGTTGPVTLIDLIAKGSRDRAILSNLRAKRDLSEATLDDIRRELIECQD